MVVMRDLFARSVDQHQNGLLSARRSLNHLIVRGLLAVDRRDGLNLYRRHARHYVSLAAI